jgi:hypothetical protein
LLAASALLASGCGGSKEDDFNNGYKPVDARLVKLENRLAQAGVVARGETNDQLQRQFGGLAREFGAIQRNVDELDAPDDLKSDQEALVQAIGDVQNDLKGIERAASANDLQAAGGATRNLLINFTKLHHARQALARKTGEKV